MSSPESPLDNAPQDNLPRRPRRFRQDRWGLLPYALVGAMAVLGLLLWGMFGGSGRSVKKPVSAPQKPIEGPTVKVALWYPSESGMSEEDRLVPEDKRTEKLAASVVKEFLRGPAGRAEKTIPANADLLGVYYGTDGVLYLDFSQGFQSGFRGDSMAEFLLLKALHATLSGAVPEAKGLKVLIEGNEIDSLGGHIYIGGLLGDAVLYEPQGLK